MDGLIRYGRRNPPFFFILVRYTDTHVPTQKIRARCAHNATNFVYNTHVLMYRTTAPARNVTIYHKILGNPPSPIPMVYNMKVPTRVTSMNRAKIINSLCKMFNKVHNNSTAPDWLLELHNSSDNDTLSARMGNWMVNYPEEFKAHGVYIM